MVKNEKQKLNQTLFQKKKKNESQQSPKDDFGNFTHLKNLI